MAIFEFRRNARVRLHDGLYRLCKRVDGATWQLENEATGRLDERTLDELLELLRVGELTYAEEPQDASGVVAKPKASPTARLKERSPNGTALWDAVTDDERAEARRRLPYVMAGIDVPRSSGALEEVCASVAVQQSDPNRPSWRTLARWIALYIRGGRDITALLSRTRFRGNRDERVAPKVIECVDEAIDQVFLTRERPTLKDTLDAAIVKVDRENKLIPRGDPKLPLPSERTVKSLLARRDQYEVCALRFGREYAEHKYHASIGYARADCGLDRVEFDHTPVNKLVIDETTFLPLGRPWLTACLDIRHRTCQGYALSFDPPSWLSVMRCMKHAILPKTYLATTYPQIHGTWPCYGVMKVAVMDNGREFHMLALDDFADRYAVTLLYCPVECPWWKGGIERYLGTVNRGVSRGHKGTTFENIFERGDYDSKRHACTTLSALHEAVHIWVVEYYHQRTHRTLGMSPLNSWEEGMRNVAIPCPTSAIELDQALAEPDRRVLTHKGVEYDDLFYNSPECRSLLIRAGGRLDVDFRRPTDNIGHIYVLDPRTEQYIDVPVIDRFAEYANGLTKWQHHCCINYARRHYQGMDDPVALAKAKDRIREICSNILNRKGKAHKRAARMQTASLQPQIEHCAVPSPAVAPLAPPGDATLAGPPQTAAPISPPVAVDYVARPARNGARVPA
ncbi:MAG TPA: hypothetical protein VF169_15100 [Albitalea sp.]|uniref:hypothetical protein n=1 Tax=Piscinibacter sp. TaxID=1903157 RepID=UPI002ED3CA2D